ncbi:unnamed protein product [Rhizoctonia solani]|uniref:Cytochrome c oxidase subunit 6B n=1 Tax=Rhizoctonia solani TaxID=456999 RepID=A0A8H3D8H7_9AGAM|nr:unnamed protein product [Rhizoctonia solani]
MSEAAELKSKYVLQTAGFDGKSHLIHLLYAAYNSHPTSYQNYIDYHKCIAAKGDDFAPCKQFYRAYRSLCPNDWVSRFDEQRENGTFPGSLEP